MQNGLMSGSDKAKLDGFASISNENGKFMSANGTWQTPKDDDSWASETLAAVETGAGLEFRKRDGSTAFIIPFAGYY